jgi:hypothetical protein
MIIRTFLYSTQYNFPLVIFMPPSIVYFHSKIKAVAFNNFLELSCPALFPFFHDIIRVHPWLKLKLLRKVIGTCLIIPDLIK